MIICRKFKNTLYNDKFPRQGVAVYITATDPDFNRAKDCQVGSISQNYLGYIFFPYKYKFSKIYYYPKYMSMHVHIKHSFKGLKVLIFP